MSRSAHVEGALITGYAAGFIVEMFEKRYGSLVEQLAEPGRTEILDALAALRAEQRRYQARARVEQNARTQAARTRMASGSDSDDVLNTKQVAEMIGGLSEARVRQLGAAGAFGPDAKAGGRWRIPRTAVMAYLESREAC